MVSSKYGQKWSNEETIIAFYYYCQIPFSQIDQRHPIVNKVADLLGRTPSSVALKMGNLGHFDPELQKRNISGLRNASKTDAEIVARFNNDWENLAYLAARLEAELIPQATDSLPVGSEREQMIRARVNQDFFRSTVLSSYQQKCCITGIDVPSLLIASHIKPWVASDPATERTNPRNGLCLNALHDKAFDQGLLTVLPDFTIRISSQITKKASLEPVEWLLQCDKQHIRLPEKFLPEKEFLEYHNDVIFRP